MRAYKTLPLGYELSDEINLETNPKNRKDMSVLSLILMVMTLPLIIFIQTTFLNILDPLIAIIGFFILIIIHETIHGLCFRFYSKEKVHYQFHGFAFSASQKNIFIKKQAYIIIGLAPALVINPILILLFILNPTFRLIFFILILLHLSGCAGDFYVVYKLSKKKADTLIEDYGIGMRIYEANK